jgi:quercetin dioxygenase-like cupin family protein
MASLTELASEHLAEARSASSGRSSVTVYGGHEHTLRQTLIALTRDNSLGDHVNPGEATLQVLQGSIRLTTADASWDGSAGDHLPIPEGMHGLDALEDSVVLLTVAKLM